MSAQTRDQLIKLWSTANQLEKTNPTESKKIRQEYWKKYRDAKRLHTELYMNA